MPIDDICYCGHQADKVDEYQGICNHCSSTFDGPGPDWTGTHKELEPGLWVPKDSQWEKVDGRWERVRDGS